MERKNVIFLTVVAIATLLVAVVGATFAYFSTTVKTNVTDDANKASVTTAKYSESTITFTTTGNKIEMTDAIPGDSKSTTFTIANTGNTDINYNIAWKSVTNTFNAKDADYVGTAPATQADELVYSLACTGGTTIPAAEKTMPLNDADDNAKIATDVTVKANQTATCTLTVTFKDTNSEQNYNQGRAFTGTVDVTTNNITNK